MSFCRHLTRIFMLLAMQLNFTNPVTGTKMITYLAGPANKQGRIVADNLVRGNKKNI